MTIETRVRPATESDIPRIVEMAQCFYRTTAYASIAPLALESAAGLAIVTMQQGVMLVAEQGDDVVGMVCLFLEPFTFNTAVMVASEIAWWLEPSARGGGAAAQLLLAADEACRARGAQVIRMALMANSPPQAAALYERFGYVHTDSHYTKVL